MNFQNLIKNFQTMNRSADDKKAFAQIMAEISDSDDEEFIPRSGVAARKAPQQASSSSSLSSQTNTGAKAHAPLQNFQKTKLWHSGK